MALSDLIAADNSAVFLNTADCGTESNIYYPHGKEPRAIKAVVEIEPAPVQDGQSHRTRTEACLVHCLESDTEGIKSPRLRDAFLIAGDDAGTQKWSFDTVQSRGGGMIAVRFTRKRIDRQGELTPNEL